MIQKIVEQEITGTSHPFATAYKNADLMKMDMLKKSFLFMVHQIFMNGRMAGGWQQWKTARM